MADPAITSSKVLLLDTMVPYDGKDSKVREEPACKYCGNSCKNKEDGGGDVRASGGRGDAKQKAAAPLLKCSRCKLVYYCNKECQQSDFANNHKKICKPIHSLTRKCEEAASTFRNVREQLIRSGLLGFQDEIHQKKHIDARLELANWILSDICWDHEMKESWEVILTQYLEILRHIVVGEVFQQSLRFKVPCILSSYLNRDDDAFAFIRYWCQDLDKSYDERLRALLDSDSKEGDWIYGREQDCRFLDIFEECSIEQHDSINALRCLLATAFIKMRLVAVFEAQQNAIGNFFSTKAGKFLHAVEPTIADYVIGEKSLREKMQAQPGQLSRLLDHIDATDPTMLPKLLQPCPPPTSEPYSVLDSGYRVYVDMDSAGTPTGYYDLLDLKHRALSRIPGANAMLAERYYGSAHYQQSSK